VACSLADGGENDRGRRGRVLHAVVLADVDSMESTLVGAGRCFDDRSVTLGGTLANAGYRVSHLIAQGHQAQLHGCFSQSAQIDNRYITKQCLFKLAGKNSTFGSLVA
jgi:hypothetical protein